MSGRIEKLERLQKLREAGALTSEEFEREKAALMDGPARVVFSSNGLWLAVGVAILVLLAALMLWLPQRNVDRAQTGSTEKLEARPNKSEPIRSVEPAIRTLSQAEQLARAFRVAFGSRSRATIAVENSQVTFRPGRLLWVGDRAVLISPGKNRADCHACAGSLAIHYLRPVRDTFEIIGAWPGAIRGWGWGEPPLDWSISNQFTSHPAIFSEGGFTGQGITCTSATLTELRPEGPVESDVIRTGFSNGGALTEERIAQGERVEELDGTIANIRRDTSFDVRFSGTSRFTERYVRRGNRFVAAAESRVPC